MRSPRVPDRASSGRRRPASVPALPPGAEPAPSARDLLLHSWAGRLFLGSAALKIVLGLVRASVGLPSALDIVGSLATFGLLVALGYFLWRLFVLTQRRLLWRVRRKLILSYIFIGVVPALLIIGFFLLGAGFLSMNVSAYLFKDGYDDLLERVKLMTQATAADIGRGAPAPDALSHALDVADPKHPGLSFAYLPARRFVILPPYTLVVLDRDTSAAAGDWEHTRQPRMLPAWVRTAVTSYGSWSGTLTLPVADTENEVELVMRSIAPIRSGRRVVGFVVGDLPVSRHVLDRLYELTGVQGGAASEGIQRASPNTVVSVPSVGNARTSGGLTLFSQSVTFLNCTGWDNGTSLRASIATSYRSRELYERLARAQSATFGGVSLGQLFLVVLLLVAILFLIIEIVALVMGLALARSITSSVHELFMGTERVRQGDFTHRIDITTKDQLGELADSFNQMTGSIENLLQTAAEKKRMEEELRIARQIQMSLLPRGPLDVPGLGITALCVPAREVGGDYYDFFKLPNDRLGVLIADVSGKGTSAALYMAELKGLVLALSQTHNSPRELLLEVNRIISENLDSRSFITMTYGVIDLPASRMTYCRAGHTPLIFLPGPNGAAPAAQVLTPNGMVLGLRIPGASGKFEELLEEDSIELSTGDVIVLYTDGITEAMNEEQDLFGEARLSRIVEEHGHLDSGELRERILREIESFVGGADQHDDMTMILLKVEQVQAGRERVAV
jgi:sigma-B regulation protein RsbU (phosphoserine phosphatase)